MRFLAGYIMRGRFAAILVATAAALGALLLPPLICVSGAAVALVTLRLGPRAGLELIGGAAVATGLLALLTVGGARPALVMAGAIWLPVWLLGWGLRRSADPGRSLWLAAGFGALVVAAIRLVLDDPVAWWQEQLQAFLSGMDEAGQASGVPEELVPRLAGLMTGATAAVISLVLAGSLLLGRWWQALLYNPGGFRREFHGLRLGRAASGLTAGLLVGGAVVPGSAGAVASELAVVAMALHMVQGLAVLHGVVGTAGLHGAWLVLVYAIMLVRPGHVTLALGLGGLIDSWIDIRGLVARRLGKDSSGGT